MNKKEKYLDLKKSIAMLGMITCGAASLVGCSQKEQTQQEDYDMVVSIENGQENNILLNDRVQEFELLSTYRVLSEDSESVVKNVYGINYYDMVVKVDKNESKEIIEENDNIKEYDLLNTYKWCEPNNTVIEVYGIDYKQKKKER